MYKYLHILHAPNDGASSASLRYLLKQFLGFSKIGGKGIHVRLPDSLLSNLISTVKLDLELAGTVQCFYLYNI